ncbi:MAG: sulfite exporter TauE/SafE family protein [Chloroflexi bacterium]|nr:sulfite exporter TauE/SafE family protein [Chloroflexota bacterium]
MQSLVEWIIVAATGAFGELVDTTAGMGFGALSTTVLVATGFVPAAVVASVNLAKVGSGIAGGLSHWRMGNVRWNWALPLAASGILGGITGALVVTSFEPDLLRRLLPWILIGMGLLIVRRAVTRGFDLPPGVSGGSAVAAIGDAPVAGEARLTPWIVRWWSMWSLHVIGFFAGMLNSATGAYGPFATSAVMLAKRGRPRYAIGTVSLVEVAVAGAVAITLLVRLQAEGIGWQLPAALMAGALITAPIGAWLSGKIPARPMDVAVGAVMIAINALVLART